MNIQQIEQQIIQNSNTDEILTYFETKKEYEQSNKEQKQFLTENKEILAKFGNQLELPTWENVMQDKLPEIYNKYATTKNTQPPSQNNNVPNNNETETIFNPKNVKNHNDIETGIYIINTPRTNGTATLRVEKYNNKNNYIVLAGSTIAEMLESSYDCALTYLNNLRNNRPSNTNGGRKVAAQRHEASSFIKNNIIECDMHFNNPSAAISFISGGTDRRGHWQEAIRSYKPLNNDRSNSAGSENMRQYCNFPSFLVFEEHLLQKFPKTYLRRNNIYEVAYINSPDNTIIGFYPKKNSIDIFFYDDITRFNDPNCLLIDKKNVGHWTAGNTYLCITNDEKGFETFDYYYSQIYPKPSISPSQN